MSYPPKSSLEAAMEGHLAKRHSKSLLRSLTTAAPTSADFSSNDFLSLRQSPALRDAFLCELQKSPDFPIGSGGSRLLDGNSPYAESLERSIASFHGAPSGLLFNSGFDANTAFFACVPQSGDVVVYDEFIHASVREGMTLSRASKALSGPFGHNCAASLRRRIEAVKGAEAEVRGGKRNVFVAVEALYSMDGDLAPLAEIVDVVEEALEKGNGYVVVDEAHSTGLYGKNGRGLVCELGLEKRVFARLHTFGKALGCNGAILLCNDLTRSYLINYARPLIYSTSMPFPSLAAIRAAYSLLKSGQTERLSSHLRSLIRHFHNQLQLLSQILSKTLAQHPPNNLHPQPLTIPTQEPQSPLFSIRSTSPRSLAKWCQEGGFIVRAIVPPTVPRGTERVRACLHAGNTVEEIDGLVKRIGEWAIAQGLRDRRDAKL